MLVNGIDLKALTPMMPARNFPDMVPGRVVHIDADFLAYQTSYEREGQPVESKDMEHNCSVAIETMRKLSGSEKVHLHLTPSSSTKGNRSAIAIQKEYQNNRKDKPKPAKLHIMRAWMAKHFPATMHQACEADDGMSSSQYAAIAKDERSLSIIASKDKDLNMVPGLHLDWDTGEIHDTPTDFGDITLYDGNSSKKVIGYGQKFFWAQLLMGDSADTIQGLPKLCGPTLSKPKPVGPALTYSLLCDINSNRAAFEYVKSKYELTGQELGYKHWQTGEDVAWQKVFISEMKLLWMRIRPHDEDCVVKWLGTVARQ